MISASSVKFECETYRLGIGYILLPLFMVRVAGFSEPASIFDLDIGTNLRLIDAITLLEDRLLPGHFDWYLLNKNSK